MEAYGFDDGWLREPVLITEIATGRVLSANRAALAALGLDTSSVVGKTTVELGVWQDSGQRNSFLSCLAIEGSIVRYPIRFLGAGGVPVEAFIAAEPCETASGGHLITRILRDPFPRRSSDQSPRDEVVGFLSRAATKFLVDEGGDFYQLVAQELRALMPNSVVVVSLYDAAESRLVAKHHSAPDSIEPLLSSAFEAIRTLDSTLISASMFESLLSGELFEVPIVRENAAEKNAVVSKFLVELGVENHLLIGLSWHGTVYGAVSCLLRPPDRAPDRAVIETFVRQASVALQRNERARALRESLHEKETLLREIHHRVKNNLQIVASLLKLQGGGVTDESTLNVLGEAAGRVQSMALVHTMLYDNQNLSSIDAGEFLRALSTQIIRSGRFDASAVAVTYDLQPIRLDPDHAVPVGLIVNELVTNALKYGMRDSEPFRLSISFRESGGGRELVVADSGGALPADFKLSSTRTLGMQLVASLTRQLRGSLSFIAGEETSFRVHFDA